MNKCLDCNTDNNLVYSGVDAFALGVMDLVGSVCYSCANTRLEEKEWESYLEGTLIQKVGSDPYFLGAPPPEMSEFPLSCFRVCRRSSFRYV